MKRTIVSLYNTLALAGLAVPGLRQNGFDSTQISFVVRNFRDVPLTDSSAGKTNRPEEISMGGLISGLNGLLANMATFTVDDIGPVIAAGPLTVLLRRNPAGGLAGTLRRLNLSDDGAETFAAAVYQGKVLIVVTAEEDRLERAAAVLKALNPARIASPSGAWRYDDGMMSGERLAVAEQKRADAEAVEESLSSLKDPLKMGHGARR